MNIELRDIESVKPYDRNPRVNDVAVEAVAKSIQQFGFRQPIVVDKDGVIVVGHTRWKAAKHLGLAQVPVHVAAELTPEQAKAYRLADNQLATIAEWNMELLPIELAELKALDFDLGILGWSPDELSEIMAPAASPGLTDPDNVPEPPAVPVTQPGDLWILGEHRLYCADSTNLDHVLRVMDGKQADLVLTDPPYGVEYEGKSKQGLRIANDDAAGLPALLGAAFGNAALACRPGACWYVAAPAGPQFLSFAQALSKLEIWRQTLVWVKDALVLGHSDYHYRHEAILYGWTPGRHRPPPTRAYTSVLEFARPKASVEHPTMKPVALWSSLMAASTRPGAVVLDPFAGSSTTMISAETLGRRAYSIELEPGFVDCGVIRWENFTGKKAQRFGADGAELPGLLSETAPVGAGKGAV